MAVQLDPQLLEILACPCDEHAPLETGSHRSSERSTGGTGGGTDVLTCTACGRRFPVVDGIPVLLLDEALPAAQPPDDGTAG